MDKYVSHIANSKNNILTNKEIVEGNNVGYFDFYNGTIEVKVKTIDNSKGIVWFEDEIVCRGWKTGEKYYWWDYFMDANAFVTKLK